MAHQEQRDARVILPHRDIALPFESYVMDDQGNVRVEMAFSDRYTEGHFPGNPIVPGHWSTETMAMAAGLALGEEVEASGKVPVLIAITGARFKKSIKPGEEITVQGHLTRKTSRIVQGAGSITLANGEEAATLKDFIVMLVDKDQVAKN